MLVSVAPADASFELREGHRRRVEDWLGAQPHQHRLLPPARLVANVDLKQPLVFYNAKYTQAVVTAVVLVLIGAFHLPQVDETIGDLMKMNGLAAAGLLSLNIFGSTALVRFLLGNVLDFGRFRTRDRGSDKAV